MSDGNISQQGLRYEMLCAKLYMGEASSLEAIAAIEQLCEDNERLASMAGRRSERIAELEAQIVYMAAAWGDDALQVEELTRQLAEARDQALEDAALRAESLGVYPELNVYNGGPEWYKHGKRIASVIRAMKGAKT